MRFLYVTTVGGTMSFFKSIIKMLVENGHTVDIACNDNIKPVDEFYSELGCNVFSISYSRNPLDSKNIRAITEIRDLVEGNKYDIVHCHTPIAAACTRIACRKFRKNGLKVIYTAHGFHFYKGAKFINWLLYFPIEWLCSFFTDELITITKEDYGFAKRHLHAKSVTYIPGVGIDVGKFKNTSIDRNEKRRELGIPEDSFVILSVGELNQNKNHEAVIRAIADINNKSIHYCIAGVGDLHDYLIDLAKQMNFDENVHLLGYRNDVNELYKMADVYILPSIREGLNVSVMEAMASGLPVICNKIRGNVDLVDENSGCVSDLENCSQNMKEIISRIYETDSAEMIGKQNSEKAEQYEVKTINKKLMQIYNGLN